MYAQHFTVCKAPPLPSLIQTSAQTYEGTGQISPPHSLTCPQGYKGGKVVELRCEPEPIPDLQSLLQPLHRVHLYTGSEEATSFNQNKIWRVYHPLVYHLGVKLAWHNAAFKVKLGAEGCGALILGGLVATESQLCRKEKSSPCQALYAISMQQLEIKILKWCDAP